MIEISKHNSEIFIIGSPLWSRLAQHWFYLHQTLDPQARNLQFSKISLLPRHQPDSYQQVASNQVDVPRAVVWEPDYKEYATGVMHHYRAQRIPQVVVTDIPKEKAQLVPGAEYFHKGDVLSFLVMQVARLMAREYPHLTPPN